MSSNNNTNELLTNMMNSLFNLESPISQTNIEEFLKKNTFNFYEIQNKSKYNLYECAICLQDFDSPYIKTTLLECEHYFYEESILTWCLKKKSIHCPICRKSFKIDNKHTSNNNINNININNLENTFNNFNNAYNNMLNFLNNPNNNNNNNNNN